MLDDIEAIATVLQAEALPLEQLGKPRSRRQSLMAQLTDDCFAFPARCCRSPRPSA